MKTKKLVIAYWADSELAFIDLSRSICHSKDISYSLFKISHEAQWFGPNRSFLKNFAHLGKTFLRIVVTGRGGQVASFGTNANRILFFFSWLFDEIFYVYNELPSFSSINPAAWTDRIIFRFARNVYVSTIERAEFVKKAYGIERPISVIENITFTKIPQIVSTQRSGKLLFSGSITAKRFNEVDLDKMSDIVRRYGERIDVYGEVAGSISKRFGPLIRLQGKVSHARMLEVMQDYRYGILSYYMGEPNYILCAPLKLYEYIANGCRVISLNRNVGLLAIAERYPALITFADDESSPARDVSDEDYLEQREQLLTEAIRSNTEFARRITDGTA